MRLFNFIALIYCFLVVRFELAQIKETPITGGRVIIKTTEGCADYCPEKTPTVQYRVWLEPEYKPESGSKDTSGNVNRRRRSIVRDE
ncbi:MAG: hypothetical protein NZO16_00960 [Deltaproteobacteria bacterium]|nr:hypothetical protein [Deltaproteobacteria bacterium]